MRIRSIVGTLAAGALATTAALTASTPAQASEARAIGNTSLATALGADGQKLDHNWKDFDIVEQAVFAVAAANPKSPVLILTKGDKRVTAFAPTDQAFRDLAEGLTGKTLDSEKKVLEAVASLGTDTIEQVLLYHVVPGATIDAAKALKSNGAKLTTALGKTLKVKVKNGKVKLVDKDPDTPNATVIVPNINKGNKQIAHGIDMVLLPADL